MVYRKPCTVNRFNMRLKNKIALITGGGNGIGKETCLLFAKEGAKVIVSDIDKKAGRATVTAIKKAGGEAAFVRADVSKPKHCQKMVNFTEKTYGGLHILFNNAGIMHSDCLLYTSPSPRDRTRSRMPSSA